jgi:hypothetical protein
VGAVQDTQVSVRGGEEPGAASLEQPGLVRLLGARRG